MPEPASGNFDNQPQAGSDWVSSKPAGKRSRRSG
jgi:hypothetical protein